MSTTNRPGPLSQFADRLGVSVGDVMAGAPVARKIPHKVPVTLTPAPAARKAKPAFTPAATAAAIQAADVVLGDELYRQVFGSHEASQPVTPGPAVVVRQAPDVLYDAVFGGPAKPAADPLYDSVFGEG